LTPRARPRAGGDSGIGRAVAVHFAREGADVAIAYLSEHKDAAETERLVSEEGRRCLKFAGDLKSPEARAACAVTASAASAAAVAAAAAAMG
jgi:NAD(P)-dependent dehydrogenase (short-subunit alcohol dehydrogenase family)